MPSCPGIVGSWFPSGYYGHFRSKSRPDFLCEYRQLAKPQPPERFLYRSMQPTAKHVFSIHDNKQAFLSDAFIFQQGVGKKRHTTSMFDFKPDFYTWMPLKEEIERSRPLESTYRLDYNKNGKNQMWVKRPKTSFETQPGITTYRYAHGTAAPNRDEITAQAGPALKLSQHQRKEGARSAAPPCRETVASCLSWYRPRATPITTDFTQSMASQAPPVLVPAPPPTAPPVMQHIPSPPPCPTPQTVAE